MNRVLPPISCPEVCPFPSSVTEVIESNAKSGVINGKISLDKKYAWIWSGSSLEVCKFSKELSKPLKNERIAYWNFDSGAENADIYIVTVQEFSQSKSAKFSEDVKLLVLINAMAYSFLCLFDVRSSQIIRMIRLPKKGTSVEIICCSGGATFDNLALSSELRYMFGIVAVGMADGSVYLLDLALDEKLNYLSHDKDPAEIFPVSLPSASDILHMREAALKCRKHLCLLIIDGKQISHKNSEVYVSGILFVRELASLAIGFSNGCFLLWNGKRITIDFIFSSDSPEHEPLPVFKFIYQEPENDPKNFCYLWAVRSHTVESSPQCTGFSSTLLFSINYQHKRWLNNYGIIFESFQSCVPRFEHVFTCDPYNGEDCFTSGSRLLNCYNLRTENDPSCSWRYSDDTLRDDEGVSAEYGKCAFLWEAFPSKNTESKFYFAIFDINQWYPAQMPSNIRLDRLEYCSFYGVYSLDEVISQSHPDLILDVQIDIRSMQKFIGNTVEEMHFYPLSLSFDAYCLTDSSITSLTYYGLQAKILHHMLSNGPRCLLEPGNIAALCSSVGLNPHDFDRLIIENQSVPWQREFLLTIALENDLAPFLFDCARQWATSDYTYCGGTLRFLMDWAWKKVSSIKRTIDSLCIPLFNCSGTQIDSSYLKQLYSNLVFLKHISILFSVMKTLPIQNTEQGMREIESRLTATELIISYLQVILWCHQVGLLPENIEGEEFGENEIAFPTSVFDNMYASRRNEIKSISSAVQETDLLLIDGYIQHLDPGIGALWEKERSSMCLPYGTANRLYPPPSIHTLLGIYLVSGVNLQAKHDIFLYMLLDLAEHLAFKYSHIVERLIKFPAAFNMDASRVSLIQGFWLLDHSMFEDAMTRLLNPGINPTDIMPWQHTQVIKSLLYQNESNKALKYRQIRKVTLAGPEDIKLYLTVLLDNSLVEKAFSFQRSVRDDKNVEELLQHFFLGCHQTKNLVRLLQLPLSLFEEEILLKYFSDCSDPVPQELLVMYYLQKNRIIEAYTLNETLKKNLTTSSLKDKQRAETRNSIVDGYLLILPNVQRKMILGLNELKLTSRGTISKEVVRPTPLSTVIKPSNVNVVSQATIISSVMDKIDENQTEPNSINCFTPFRNKKHKVSKTPYCRIPFICTPSNSRLNYEKADISSIVYPENTTMKDLNMTRESFAESPPKYARHYSDISPMKFMDSARNKSAKYISADFLFVLQTPTVHRQSRVSILGAATSESARKSMIPPTPHSILKARSMLRSSISPIQPPKFTLVDEEPYLDSDEEREIDKTPEKSISKSVKLPEMHSVATPKQLRFDLSDAEDSKEDSSISKSVEFAIDDDICKKSYPKEASPLVPTSKSTSDIPSSGIVTEDSDVAINFDAHLLRYAESAKNSPVKDSSLTTSIQSCSDTSLNYQSIDENIEPSKADGDVELIDTDDDTNCEIFTSPMAEPEKNARKSVSFGSSPSKSLEHSQKFVRVDNECKLHLTLSESEDEMNTSKESNDGCIQVENIEDFIEEQSPSRNPDRCSPQKSSSTTPESSPSKSTPPRSTSVTPKNSPLKSSPKKSTSITPESSPSKSSSLESTSMTPESSQSDTSPEKSSSSSPKRSPKKTSPRKLTSTTPESSPSKSTSMTPESSQSDASSPERSPRKTSPRKSTSTTPESSPSKSTPESSQSDASSPERSPKKTSPRKSTSTTSESSSPKPSPQKSASMTPESSQSDASPEKSSSSSPKRSPKKPSPKKSASITPDGSPLRTSRHKSPSITPEGSPRRSSPLSSSLSCLSSLRSSSLKLSTPESPKPRRSSRSPSHKSKESREKILEESVKLLEEHSPAETPKKIGIESFRVTRSSLKPQMSPKVSSSAKKQSSRKMKPEFTMMVDDHDEQFERDIADPIPDSETTTFKFSPANFAPKALERNDDNIEDNVTPLKSFIFSPPLTRSRTRKRLSSQQNMSFNESAILFDSLTNISNVDGGPRLTPVIEQPSTSSKTQASRSKMRKDSSECISLGTSSQSIINFSSPALENDIKPPKRSRKKVTAEKSRYVIQTRRSMRLSKK